MPACFIFTLFIMIMIITMIITMIIIMVGDMLFFSFVYF